MSTIETMHRTAPTPAETDAHRASTNSQGAWPTAPTRTAFRYDLAVVGLGYVGLPTALAAFAAGLRVLALDVSPDRIAAVAARRADLIDDDRLRLGLALGDPRFVMTVDAAHLRHAEHIVVCVPTPVDEHLVPDLTLLRAACDTVAGLAVGGQTVMLTSTSYVGCTRDLLVAPLERFGYEVGRDVFVAYSPERIDPGNATVTHDGVPRVVGGATPACVEHAVAMLGRTTDHVHPVSTLEAAEMTKILENTFRAVNIALANEFADICRGLDIAVVEVIDAAATKPYGFMPFRPGPGVGGHCIPCDPHYLLWQLHTSRVDAPMITQAMTEIAARPGRVAARVQDVLSAAGRGITDARIMVVGASYKADVADVRESPALEILETLAGRGAIVAYVDDHVPSVRLHDDRVLYSCDDPSGFGPHVVLLHTRHASMVLDWIPDDAIVLDATFDSAWASTADARLAV